MKVTEVIIKVVIIFVFIFISLTACKKYTIEQKVTSWYELELQTSIWDHSDPFCAMLIERWNDKVISDSVKCLRYNQAKELIKKIEEVESFNCESK